MKMQGPIKLISYTRLTYPYIAYTNPRIRGGPPLECFNHPMIKGVSNLNNTYKQQSLEMLTSRSEDDEAELT